MAHTPESVKWQQSQLPKEAIEDAEKFVEENFKGLSDFIEDADILIWYKALIVSAITDYQYKPKQEVIDQDKKGFTYPTQGIKPQKEYWQPSGNIPNSNWQPDTIEKQVSERIAGYIHEIDSLHIANRELWEKIESDAVEFVEWILKEEFEMGIYSFFKKDNVTEHEYSPQELYKLFKNKQ